MTEFLDVLANLFWPFVISAAAWTIAVCALAQPSELSQLIKSLTGTKATAGGIAKPSLSDPRAAHSTPAPHAVHSSGS